MTKRVMMSEKCTHAFEFPLRMGHMLPMVGKCCGCGLIRKWFFYHDKKMGVGAKSEDKCDEIIDKWLVDKKGNG